jgi:N-acetyl-alpha-D-muramate 1-phosphate uridylyltransferase
MQIAILAGGLATRLKPLTDKIPKSLVQIKGKTFLEYQLDFLKAGGVTDVLLCIGHLGELIEEKFSDGRKYGVRLKYSREGDTLLGTAGALKKAGSLLEDEFFVMYGDSYLFLDFTNIMCYFKNQNKLALMTVYKNRGLYDKSNTYIEGNLVRRYSKQDKTGAMVYIDYGANILRKEVLNLVPSDQPYPLEDLFPVLIKQNELLAYEVKERFYEIGSPDGLAEFRKYTTRLR